MSNMIHTNQEMISSLKEAGIPMAICEAIAEVYPVADIRPIINSEDITTLKSNIKNVGEKRARIIIDALKGRLPEPMSQPVPDLRAPDVEMYEIPEFDLVWDKEASKAKLQLNKEKNRKRFGPALQMLQKISGQKNPGVFTTVSEIPQDRNNPVPGYAMEQLWKKALCGITIKGKVYQPLIMGTNAKMKCQIHCDKADGDNRGAETARKARKEKILPAVSA